MRKEDYYLFFYHNLLIHLLTEIHVSAWSAEKCYWQVIHGYIEVYIYIVNWYGFEQNKFQPVCILILSFFFVYIHLCKINFEWTQKTLNFIIYLKTNDMCLLSPFGMFFFLIFFIDTFIIIRIIIETVINEM